MTSRTAMVAVFAATVALASATACAPKRPAIGPTPPVDRTLPCHGPTGVVAWMPEAQHDQPTLDRWCRSVGPPVVTAVAAPSVTVRRLVILSWNIGVGAGRIVDLANLIRARAPRPASGEVGIVLLLQEAFRGGLDVPDTLPENLRAPGAIRPGRPTRDIVEVAETLGMSMAYVPSMRNGPAPSVYEREDRGNAVLSTEPLSGITAIELPMARQRRVAVAATVTLRGSTSQLRVVAGHLDTPGSGSGEQARRLAAFIATTPSVPPTVLGIDTNEPFGRSGPSVNTLEAVLHIPPGCARGRTGPWPFGRIDFILTNLAAEAETCETLTDRYGSDHRPALLTVDF